MKKVLPFFLIIPLVALFFYDPEEGPLLLPQEKPKINLGMARDLAMIKELEEQLPGMEVAGILSAALRALQEKLPFNFPPEYYNVLCIEEAPRSAPFPYEIHQRLYLDETELGMPFYLDVRVFKDSSEEEVIAWHTAHLEGRDEQWSEGRYTCMGSYTPSPDAGHGFAALQGERKSFFHCIAQDGILYCCFAEAPAAVFDRHLSLFKWLCQR